MVSSLRLRTKRRDWPIGKGPTTNYSGRVDVSVAGKPAVETYKFRLRTTVFLVNMPTARTFPRSVTRVHFNDRHACKSCLVENEQLEHSESPRLEYRSLLPRSPDP